jgi:hypothetical protein
MANKNPRIIVKGKKWLISPMVIKKKKNTTNSLS